MGSVNIWKAVAAGAIAATLLSGTPAVSSENKYFNIANSTTSLMLCDLVADSPPTLVLFKKDPGPGLKGKIDLRIDIFRDLRKEVFSQLEGICLSDGYNPGLYLQQDIATQLPVLHLSPIYTEGKARDFYLVGTVPPESQGFKKIETCEDYFGGGAIDIEALVPRGGGPNLRLLRVQALKHVVYDFFRTHRWDFDVLYIGAYYSGRDVTPRGRYIILKESMHLLLESYKLPSTK